MADSLIVRRWVCSSPNAACLPIHAHGQHARSQSGAWPSVSTRIRLWHALASVEGEGQAHAPSIGQIRWSSKEKNLMQTIPPPLCNTGAWMCRHRPCNPCAGSGAGCKRSHAGPKTFRCFACRHMHKGECYWVCQSGPSSPRATCTQNIEAVCSSDMQPAHRVTDRQIALLQSKSPVTTTICQKAGGHVPTV